MVFDKLKLRDAPAAMNVGDLAADHRRGSERLRRVAHAVESVLADQELLRQTINDIICDFIEQRRHMAVDERDFFPAAVKVLQSQDWAEIASRIIDLKNVEERFEIVRKAYLAVGAGGRGGANSAFLM
jgi:hemerythrin-like domain-containing protein